MSFVLPSTVTVLKLSPQLRAVMTIIRNKNTSRADFVFYADRIATMVIEEGLNHMPYNDETVVTPTDSEYKGLKFGARICGVSIMRAGESMEPPLMRTCREVRIGKILIQRNEETAEPALFYHKLPQDIHRRHVFLLDPMVATGGSAITAIEVLLDAGVPEEHILFMNIISCPEGIEALYKRFPKLKIITAEIDSNLDEKKYIIPGIGDFGDRYFGTDKFDYVKPE